MFRTPAFLRDGQLQPTSTPFTIDILTRPRYAHTSQPYVMTATARGEYELGAEAGGIRPHERRSLVVAVVIYLDVFLHTAGHKHNSQERYEGNKP